MLWLILPQLKRTAPKMEVGILLAASAFPAARHRLRSNTPLIFVLAMHRAPDRQEPGSAPWCFLLMEAASCSYQVGPGQSSRRAARAAAPRDGARSGVRTHDGKRQDGLVLAAAGQCEEATQRHAPSRPLPVSKSLRERGQQPCQFERAIGPKVRSSQPV